MRILRVLALALLLTTSVVEAANFYPVSGGLTGNTTGTLDKISGADLADGDVALVVLKNDPTYGTVSFVYKLNATSGASASPPNIVSPATSAGTKRWILVSDSRNEPTTNQKAALAGTSGTAPSASNKLVDSADTRMTDARTPSSTLAHAASHAVGEDDVVTPAAIEAVPASDVSTTPAPATIVKTGAGNTFAEGFVPSLTSRTVENLTVSRILVSDEAGALAASSTSASLLGYLDISSSLAGLLGGKANTTHEHAGSAITSGTVPSSAIPLANGSQAGGLSSTAGCTAGWAPVVQANGTYACGPVAGSGGGSAAVTLFSTAQAPQQGDMVLGRVYRQTSGSAIEVTLPTAAINLTADLSASSAVLRTASASDVLTLNGTALSAGHKLECASWGYSKVLGTAANAWDVMTLAGAACTDDGEDTYGSFVIDSGASYDYADTAVGAYTDHTFVATITGSVTFDASTPVRFTTGTDWSIVAESNTCIGTKTNTTCQVVIRFEPTGAGDLSDTLIFDSDITDVEVALTGSGTDSTAPTLSSATIGADGTTLTMVFDEAVVCDPTSDCCDALALETSTAGAVTFTYSSGSGTPTIICTGDVTVYTGDTVVDGLDYTQPGNGIEDVSGNDLVTFDPAESVTIVGATPVGQCDGTEVLCIEFAGTGTTAQERARNVTAGDNETAGGFTTLSGTCLRDDDVSWPQADPSRSSPGADHFGGQHWIWCDGGAYVRKSSLSLSDHWYYVKFSPAKSSAVATYVFRNYNAAIPFSAIITSNNVKFYYYNGSATTQLNGESTGSSGVALSMGAVYHLTARSKMAGSGGAITTWKLYDVDKALIDQGTVTGYSSATAVNLIDVGAYNGGNDCDIGLVKITTTEPTLVP